ncbi:hypothetical protein H8356DRAFT_1302855 [Neocallimastix lanati (nom. inval.)]|nr:hypothetical protein H8356DRAFT_1302855 [Neocallimastix sp. JGI-2020a]
MIYIYKTEDFGLPHIEILKYESLHNHLEKDYDDYDASVSIANHKIKDEIRKSSIPLVIGPKLIFIFNEVSQEIGFICHYYKTIKSQITRNINRQLLSDVTKFVDHERPRNDIAELWFKCLININNINTNL